MNSKKKQLAVILAAYIFKSSDEEVESKEVSKKSRVWVKDWVARREQEGFCSKLYRELRDEEPELYKNFVRMTCEQFDHLLSLVSPLITKKDTVMRKSIPASNRLILTLRYLATGESFRSLQYVFRIPYCTISTIIPEVLDAIYKVLLQEYLQVPKCPDDWKDIARDFLELWQIPNCIGEVDGKHVAMFAPPHAGSVFYNYKGSHSTILMAIAGPTYKLIYVDVGRNGRFSDGGVFNRCTFVQALDSNRLGLPSPKPLPGRSLPVPYALVADDAFALRQNLMKPYSQRGLTMVRRVFNYRISRARRIVENVFGIMTTRFRVLLKPIQLSPEKTKKNVLACCVLHNYLITTNKNNYASPGTFDQYSRNGELIPGKWRQEAAINNDTMFSLERESHPANAATAEEIRSEFAAYFTEEGELDWQNKLI